MSQMLYRHSYGFDGKQLSGLNFRQTRHCSRTKRPRVIWQESGGYLQGEIYAIISIFERFVKGQGNNECRASSIDVGLGKLCLLLGGSSPEYHRQADFGRLRVVQHHIKVQPRFGHNRPTWEVHEMARKLLGWLSSPPAPAPKQQSKSLTGNESGSDCALEVTIYEKILDGIKYTKRVELYRRDRDFK